MNIKRLLSLTISWVALLPGTGLVAPQDTAPQQTSPAGATKSGSGHWHDALADQGKDRMRGRPSDRRLNRRHLSEENRPSGLASTAQTSRPGEIPFNRQHSMAGYPINSLPAGPNRSEVAAKRVLIHNQVGNVALSTRLHSIATHTASPPSGGQHRGSNPPVIVGSANSKTGNTGTINGTHMNRKP